MFRWPALRSERVAHFLREAAAGNSSVYQGLRMNGLTSAETRGTAGQVLTFGPFTLVEGERRLMRDGVAVEIGGRAMDVLIALLSRANEVVR